MSALPHHPGVFTLAIRNYWWMSVFGGVYFVGGFLAWGGSRGAIVSSGVFLAGAVLGLLGHYLVRVESRVVRVGLVLAHQLLGQAVLIWQKANLPLGRFPAVSAGWVRCDGLTLDQAMTQADDALYTSKERRKALAGRPRAQRA